MPGDRSVAEARGEALEEGLGERDFGEEDEEKVVVPNTLPRTISGTLMSERTPRAPMSCVIFASGCTPLIWNSAMSVSSTDFRSRRACGAPGALSGFWNAAC